MERHHHGRQYSQTLRPRHVACIRISSTQECAVDTLRDDHRDVINAWRDTAARLTREVDGVSGLTAVPHAQALHATAQTCTPAQTRLSAPPSGWQDWWEKRHALAAREVSAQEIAHEASKRLAEVHGATNACMEILEPLAMAQARAVDEGIARGDAMPLLAGMPLAHKDLLHRTGYDVGYGRRDAIASTSTATVLRRFDQAGALHLARLHMTELAFDPSGANESVGSCRNPWALDRITGGSSSGSAAVVAAGAVDGALGSDTGGSIRIPAALCGVTGIKPTYGLVSRAGAMSLSASHDHLGPLARSARDCALMLQAIAGHDLADAGSVTAPSAQDYLDSLDATIAGLRIGVPRGYFTRDLDPQVQSVLDQSVASFQALGAEIREVPDFPYDAINDLAILMIRAEATTLYDELIRPGSGSLGKFTASRLGEGVSIPATLYLQAASLRGPMLLKFVRTVMAEVDVLMAPVFPTMTPRIDAFDAIDARSSALRGALTRLTRPLNYLGLPALSLPGGMGKPDDSEVELPVGFQLIGRPYSESLLLRAGHAFQKATSWHLHRPPPLR
ncbi:amidase [Bordetella sp. 15P40C-2]|nr:amidase [Bordetella sp. 15P40C-2]